MARDDEEAVGRLVRTRPLTAAERTALAAARQSIRQRDFAERRRRGGWAVEVGLALALAAIVIGIVIGVTRHPGHAVAMPAAPPVVTTPPPVVTATPSPQPSPSAPPAARHVMAPEACGGITHYQDGNAGPILCPDGKPSAAADRWARSYTPRLAILGLGMEATVSQVTTALCADTTQSRASWPIERSVYTLVRAEQDWRFSFDFDAFQMSGGCA